MTTDMEKVERSIRRLEAKYGMSSETFASIANPYNLMPERDVYDWDILLMLRAVGPKDIAPVSSTPRRKRKNTAKNR